MTQFDYSEFHPLDHRIASGVCFGWYGGPTHHARLWWQYGERPHPIGALLCRLGYHDMIPYWAKQQIISLDLLTDENATGQMCKRCWYTPH